MEQIIVIYLQQKRVLAPRALKQVEVFKNCQCGV